MNRWVRRGLMALYPRSWRVRYEDEFDIVLDLEPLAVRTVVNVARWACYERIRAMTDQVMMMSGRGLVLMVYAYLAAITAGVNLYWTVDDTPLIAVMHAHRSLFLLWKILAGAAFVALAAVVTAVVPILLGIVQSASKNRRYDILRRLAFPLGALALLLAWIAIVASRTHWAPTPWDITGDWHAPDPWPSLGVRWLLGSITGVLLVTSLIGSALALKQAIERSACSRSTFVGRVLFVLAASIVCMAGSVVGWGVLMELHAPAAFHSRAGGLFGSASIVSWAVSSTLFVGAAIAALRGARIARTLTRGSVS